MVFPNATRIYKRVHIFTKLQ